MMGHLDKDVQQKYISTQGAICTFGRVKAKGVMKYKKRTRSISVFKRLGLKRKKSSNQTKKIRPSSGVENMLERT